MVRCAHISDLHFAKPSWKIHHFFSKRWIGNANFYLRRRSQFCFENIQALPLLFKQLEVSKVLITGDLTTTSDKKEFLMAQAFIQRLEEQGLLVLLLPGNHDQYTKADFSQKTYYRFFPSHFSESTCNLKDDGLTVVKIGNKWSAIFLDTAIATPPLACYGFFSPELEKKLKQTLKQMPKDHSVLILNHFPLIYNEAPEKGLKRSEALCDLIKEFPRVNLYLHGHTHRHCIADLRQSNLPIILDSGSITEKKMGSWNLIELHEKEFWVEGFKIINSKWQPTSRSYFKVNNV